MKTIKNLLLAASLLPLFLSAQNALTHSAGVSADAGFSNLFFGKNAFSGDYARPLLGGGGGLALFYELQYRRLLVHTGLGFDYTANRNRLDVPEYIGSIAEYPAMKWHYNFDRYTEHTGYGTAWIPVMLGGRFDRWYFLAGAKIGVFNFGSTQPVTKVNIWAEDPDVIDPMKNLYTHQLTDYTFKGQKTNPHFAPFNLMGSLEAGMYFGMDKDDEENLSALDAAQLYERRKEKKPFKDCLRYRLSLFVDYGFSNLLAGHTADGSLLAFNEVSDITPHSIYDYSDYAKGSLNNFLIGAKFAVICEVPNKAPRAKKGKGSQDNPYLVTYVSDKRTGEPVGDAEVAIQRSAKKGSGGKGKKRVYRSLTDKVTGGTYKALPEGKYKIAASKEGYVTQRVTFKHADRFDTVRIALQPQLMLRSQAIDALTGRPVDANIAVIDEKGDTIAQTSMDSLTKVVSAFVDFGMLYTVCASSEGYKDTCVQASDAEKLLVVRLEPEKVKKFVLQNMFFATDKADILSSSESALQELYNLLSDNPDIRIRIIGHTDDVGRVEYNQRLSEDRSASVKQEMVKRGIAAGRIETAGHGELDPIVANDSDEHRQLNRRVEIEILSGASVEVHISNEQLPR